MLWNIYIVELTLITCHAYHQVFNEFFWWQIQSNLPFLKYQTFLVQLHYTLNFFDHDHLFGRCFQTDHCCPPVRDNLHMIQSRDGSKLFTLICNYVFVYAILKRIENHIEPE